MKHTQNIFTVVPASFFDKNVPGVPPPDSAIYFMIDGDEGGVGVFVGIPESWNISKVYEALVDVVQFSGLGLYFVRDPSTLPSGFKWFVTGFPIPLSEAHRKNPEFEARIVRILKYFMYLEFMARAVSLAKGFRVGMEDLS